MFSTIVCLGFIFLSPVFQSIYKLADNQVKYPGIPQFNFYV